MKNLANKMRVIDLFSGCGGFSIGMQNAGFNVVAGFDNWELAVETYSCNLKHPAFILDLSNLQEDFDIFHKFEPDIIIGGPPCQDFSSAGKRDENLGRGDLTIAFAEIVISIKPKFFIMENVDRFTKTAKYQLAKRIFKSSGYAISEKILDASLCGVPQNRRRFFWIGELNGEDEKIKYYLDKNLSNQPMTIRQYLNSIGKTLDIQYYYRHPRSYQRRAIFSIDEPSPTIRGVNRPMPKTYKPHPGDVAPVTSAIRPLTTMERSWLQTFPSNFIFKGSKTDIEQMIGNAVPVKLAEYVALCLVQYIEDSSNITCENSNNKNEHETIKKYIQLSLIDV